MTELLNNWIFDLLDLGDVLTFRRVSKKFKDIVNEFKTRYFDNERFFDRFAKGKFGQYLLDRHAETPDSIDRDVASRRIEESQLFIEASHACELRLESTAILAAAAEA